MDRLVILYDQNGGADTIWGDENSIDENSIDENSIDGNSIDGNSIDGNSIDENSRDENSRDENSIDENRIEIYQKRRSCLIGVIDKNIYNRLKGKIRWFEEGDGKSSRSGGIYIYLYKPMVPMAAIETLITTDDYIYPDRVECHSSLFLNDVINDIIEDCLAPLDSYRVVAVDHIWCRQNTLNEKITEALQ